MPTAPRREWALRGALLAFGLAAALLLGELACRLLASRLFRLESETHRFDPELGWRQQEGPTLTRRNEEGVAVRVVGSALGTREPPQPYRDPACNVMASGDSFTAGTQVPWPDTWVARLQQHVAPLQVVNAGVDGYDLAQSYRLARRLWPHFHPRHLLAAVFVGNDLLDYTREAQARPPWEGAWPLAWLRERSYLLHLLSGWQRAAGLEAGEEGPGNNPLPNFSPRSVPGFEALAPNQKKSVRRQFAAAELLPVLRGNAEGRARLAASERVLDGLAALARGQGAGFSVLVIPVKQQTIPAQRVEWTALHGLREEQVLEPQRELARWAAAAGVPLVDATPALAAAAHPEELYWPVNQHMGPAGHRLLAEVVAAALGRRLAADCGGPSG